MARSFPALRRSIATVLLALAACRADRITKSPVSVAADTDAWAGNPLVLRSSAFSGGDSLATVTLGAESLAVHSFGGDSIAVQLPDTDGALTLSLRLPSGAAAPQVTVRVHGFEGIRVGPRVSGYPYPWPAGGPTALAFQDGRLVRLDYRDNSATVLTGDTNLGPPCLVLPTPSAAEPGLVVVAASSDTGSTNCGRIVAVPTSSWSAPADTSDYNGWSWGMAAHLGRGRWLVSHTETFLDSTTPEGGLASVCSESENMVVSPRGDRVVPLCSGSAPTAPTAPVIDVAGYTVAYGFPELYGLLAAAFTERGDTVFVLGRTSGSGVRWELLEADAATGRVLSRIPRTYSDERDISAAVVPDPGRPWLYVLGWADTLVPYIEVLDRVSLAHVATLRVPAWAAPSVPSVPWGNQLGSWLRRGDWTLLLSPLERHLYATMTDWSRATSRAASPTSVLIFDLVP